MQNLFKKIDDGVKAVFESDSYKKCLRYMSKFTNYSAGNCILIMLQKPDASLVAAFGKWKELGRTINKGEKGIAILAPMKFKSKEVEEQFVKDGDGKQVFNVDGSEKKETVENEVATIGFKKVYVFDVSQTSGEPIPEYVHELNEDIEDEHIEAVISAVRSVTGLPVEFEDIDSGAMSDDPRPVPSGTMGTVIGVDDMCSIMVKWDNGQGLSLVPGVDSFHVISQEESESEEADMEMQI